MLPTIFERLPLEITTSIFESAASDDLNTACQLCLVSQSIREIASPILYRHIYLSGTEQIKRFNATIKLSPKLGDSIYGMTLHDEELQGLPANFINEAIYKADESTSWIIHWKTLIRYIGVLSRCHRLSTLVLSLGAWRRLQYHRNDGTEEGRRGILIDQLKRSNIQLDHLVVSHLELSAVFTLFNMKKLSWYGCEVMLTLLSQSMNGALSMSKEKADAFLRSKSLQEIHFMLGDNHHYYHDVLQAKERKFDWKQEIGQGWTEILTEQMQMISTILPLKIEYHIHLHRLTQQANKPIVLHFDNLRDINVKVDSWGKLSDIRQRPAEMEDFASNGWISKHSCVEGKKTKKKKKKKKAKSGKKKSEVTDQDETQDASQSRNAKEEWCGCVNIDNM